jgi:hypothetical protein
MLLWGKWIHVGNLVDRFVVHGSFSRKMVLISISVYHFVGYLLPTSCTS